MIRFEAVSTTRQIGAREVTLRARVVGLALANGGALAVFPTAVTADGTRTPIVDVTRLVLLMSGLMMLLALLGGTRHRKEK